MLVLYTPIMVADPEPPSDPEPAGVAPAGTGKPFGQFGGSWPVSDTDTWPFGVATAKLLLVAALVVVLAA